MCVPDSHEKNIARMFVPAFFVRIFTTIGHFFRSRSRPVFHDPDSGSGSGSASLATIITGIFISPFSIGTPVKEKVRKYGGVFSSRYLLQPHLRAKENTVLIYIYYKTKLISLHNTITMMSVRWPGRRGGTCVRSQDGSQARSVGPDLHRAAPPVYLSVCRVQQPRRPDRTVKMGTSRSSPTGWHGSPRCPHIRWFMVGPAPSLRGWFCVQFQPSDYLRNRCGHWVRPQGT